MAAMAGCSDKASSTALAPAAVDAHDTPRVSSKYDASGKLETLEYDRNNDGKPDMWGFMNGTQVVRVEVDENGDGVVDRWEFHRSGDDAGTNAGGPPGLAPVVDRTLEHVERATKFDGKVSRWEYFTGGVLTRIEEDTDGDGKVDKWESYRAGTLETVGPVTQSLRRTEHDLASSIATLKVETLLKSIEARSQPETIEVELPMSTDVLWQRTHEPAAGCRAVFFLRDRYGAAHADGHQFADPPRAQRFFVDDVVSIDELDDLHAIAAESADQ